MQIVHVLAVGVYGPWGASPLVATGGRTGRSQRQIASAGVQRRLAAEAGNGNGAGTLEDTAAAASHRPGGKAAETVAEVGLAMALECDGFVLEPPQVAELKARFGLSEAELLYSLIEPTQRLARPPVSDYHVGAVGLGESGRVLLGVNVELHGLPLNQSIHAEQFVIANAVRVGERRLTRLAVSAEPCGHCRQVRSMVLSPWALLSLLYATGSGDGDVRKSEPRWLSRAERGCGAGLILRSVCYSPSPLLHLPLAHS
jgi:cytidine deaminase